MAGYVKRIALIKTLRAGYSADGGALKGVVRCESCFGMLRADISLLNFAPQTEGRYIAGISDGRTAVLFDPPRYDGECAADISRGFACLVAYSVGDRVVPVASAVCGPMEGALPALQRAMERDEAAPGATYNDEAIAENNYYEVETVKDGSPVCEGEEGPEGHYAGADEDFVRNVGRSGGEIFPQSHEVAGEGVKCSTSAFRIGGTPEDGGVEGDIYGGRSADEELMAAPALSDDGAEDKDPVICADKAHNADVADGGALEAVEGESDGGEDNAPALCADEAQNAGEEGNAEEGSGDEPAPPRLGGGGYYERMLAEIKSVFAVYPRDELLEDVMEQAKWVKVGYGGGKYYSFGVVYVGGNAKYICYGVPVEAGACCPESLAGRAAYVPVDGGGYWIMYQDAQTGVSITPESC